MSMRPTRISRASGPRAARLEREIRPNLGNARDMWVSYLFVLRQSAGTFGGERRIRRRTAELLEQSDVLHVRVDIVLGSVQRLLGVRARPDFLERLVPARADECLLRL